MLGNINLTSFNYVYALNDDIVFIYCQLIFLLNKFYYHKYLTDEDLFRYMLS